MIVWKNVFFSTFFYTKFIIVRMSGLENTNTIKLICIPPLMSFLPYSFVKCCLNVIRYCRIWTTTLTFSEVSWPHPGRCIYTFISEDKHRHLFCCVLLLSEYFVWFVTSCTAQADTAASQHHSCFSIYSTGLDWWTFKPTHKLDLSSQNMVCKVSSGFMPTC